MSEGTKRWQTEIWIGEALEHPVVVYGESLEMLRSTTAAWLTAHAPINFSNVPPNFNVPQRKRTYFYSDGSCKLPVFSLDTPGATRRLAAGWYFTEGASLYPEPHPLENFEVVIHHFVEQAMIPEKGPDYKEMLPGEDSHWAHRLTHPMVFGAMVGAIASLCYLSVPVGSGYGGNFIMSQHSFIPIIFLVLFMIVFFAVLGAVIFKGLKMIETVKHSQTGRKRFKT